MDSADGTTSGESSFAMRIVNSTGLTLSRVKLVAGKGANSDDGTDGQDGADGAQTNPNHGLDAICTNPPTGQVGGGWGTFPCGTVGGHGGPRTSLTRAPRVVTVSRQPIS